MTTQAIHDTDRKVFEAARRWRAMKIKQIGLDFASGKVSAAQIVRRLRAVADEIEQTAPNDQTELRLCVR